MKKSSSPSFPGHAATDHVTGRFAVKVKIFLLFSAIEISLFTSSGLGIGPLGPVMTIEVLDVSVIETTEVVPTWVDLVESEKSLILRVSFPSVVASLARVCAKEKSPLLSTVPEPVREPEEKSELLIPVPESE